MKKNALYLIAAVAITVSSCMQPVDQNQAETAVPSRDFLQLKVYTCDTEEQLATLDAHFQEALLPALHKAGLKDIGVFKPIAGEQLAVFMLIPFKSLDQMVGLPSILSEDAEYQQAGKAYIDAAHDAPSFARIESYILHAFSENPKMATPDLSSPRAGRVYELRSYEGATEKLYDLKVEMFNEGESDLFVELGFNPVFFAEVISSSHMPHLMYMTTHADTTAQKENWAAFVAHPEWERMKNLERYQNTVSHIDKYLLYPTDYSDY